MQFFDSHVEPPLEKGGPWRGRASFHGEEPLFADHFPGYPLVPGVLLFEILRATAERAVRETMGTVRLSRATRIRLIRPVIPPTDLVACVSVNPKNPFRVQGELLDSDEEIVATACFDFEVVGESE